MSRDEKVTPNPTFEFPDIDPERRLWELILYVAEKSEGDPTFGKVKLAKYCSLQISGRMRIMANQSPEPDT